MAIDFLDLASRYANARLDQAAQPFTDPEGYVNKRMQDNYGVDLYGNTKPKSTTINYNDDGTQTITQKHEVTPPDQSQTSMPPASYGQVNPVDYGQAAPAPVAQQAAPAAAPESVGPPAAPAAAPEPVGPPAAPAAITAENLPPAPEAGPPVQVAGPMVQPPAPAAPVAPTPAPAAATQTNAPVAPVNPYTLTAPAPQMGLKVPGTPTVAPAAQAPMSVGAEPAITKPEDAAAANQLHYSDDIGKIYNDPNKLAAYMGNDANPEAGRKVAAALLKIQLNGADDRNIAEQKLTAMAQGDQKASNQVMRDLRSQDGSWVKAILFARLGLNDLAKEEQGKLSTERKVSRAILDGDNYAVIMNNQGAITKAYDDTGAVVSDKTLAKLNSSSTVQGTHAYGFTGEPGVVTDANGKESEVRQRTNSINGRVEYVYVTGPNAGKVYTGDARPMPKSISTAMSKDDYRVLSTLRDRFGTNVLDAEKQFQTDNGPFTSDAERNAFRQKYGFVSSMPGGAPTGLTQNAPAQNAPAQNAPAQNAPAQNAPAQNAPAPAPSINTARNPIVGNQPVTLPAPPQRKDYSSDTQFKLATENYNKLRDYNLGVAKEQAGANIEVNKQTQLIPIEGRKAAATTQGNQAGATVAQAGVAQNTIDNANHAIDLLDSGKHNVGPIVAGTLQGGGPIGQAIGTQLNTESARNTKAIMDTVRSMGAAASQAQIKGHLTNDQLKFITENKPNEQSDPAYVRQWLEKSIKYIQDAQNYATPQATAGGNIPNPVVTQQAAPPAAPKATKRYNPATRSFEDIK